MNGLKVYLWALEDDATTDEQAFQRQDTLMEAVVEPERLTYSVHHLKAPSTGDCRISIRALKGSMAARVPASSDGLKLGESTYR